MPASRLFALAFALIAIYLPLATPVPTLASLGVQTATRATRGYGAIVFRLKVPRRSAPTAVGLQRTRPLYISLSTKSVVILTDGKNPVIANINPTTQIASVSFQVPAGTHTFGVTAYDQLGGKGNVLSTGTAPPVNVPPTGLTQVSLTLGGVVASVVLTLDRNDPTIGAPAVINLNVIPMDADGNIIVGSSPYDYVNALFAGPITLSSSDPVNGKLSQTTLTQEVDPFPQDFHRLSVTYSGANVPRITISASSTGLKSVTPALLLPLPRPPSGEQLLVTGGDDPNTVFSTAKSYQLLATFGVPAMTDAFGSAAVDTVANDFYVEHFSPMNTCCIDVYHAGGSYGLVEAFDPNVIAQSLALDAAGQKLYAADVISGNIAIISTTSGHARIGTISAGLRLAGTDGQIALDSTAQRLYVSGTSNANTGMEVFSTVPPYAAIAEFGAGSFTSIAVDPAAGRVYALGYLSNTYPHPLYVYVYATSNLKLLGQIGPVGELLGPSQNTTPAGIAIDPNAQQLYVVEQSLNGPIPYASDVLVYGVGSGLSFPFLGSFVATADGEHIVVAPHAP